MDVTPILQKAAEVGRMIRRTTIYTGYVRLRDEVNGDPRAKSLMDEYTRMAGEIAMRERSGDFVEDFEKDELRELVERIGEDELLVDYIHARDMYIMLLENVRNSLMEMTD